MKKEKNYLKKQKSLAFTLAEMLIVLGILGVLSAFTIPPLISNYQKQVTVNGVKKAYSMLTQAVKLSEVNNGAIETWDFPTLGQNGAQCLLFANTYLAPYLNITKKCDLNTGCWPSSVKKLNGNSGSPMDVTVWQPNTIIKYALSDGTALSIINYGYSFTPANTGRLNIFVDINGQKQPNIVGKDIFAFILVQKAASGYNSGEGDLAHNVKAGGIYPDGSGMDITVESYTWRGCGKDVTNAFAGAFCAQKIIQDGWQIKDDYPWN